MRQRGKSRNRRESACIDCCCYAAEMGVQSVDRSVHGRTCLSRLLIPVILAPCSLLLNNLLIFRQFANFHESLGIVSCIVGRFGGLHIENCNDGFQAVVRNIHVVVQQLLRLV